MVAEVYPVKHSFSAAMHTAAFKKLNINAEYRLFEVPPKDLEGFLLGKIKTNDVKGKEFLSSGISFFNITIPHKIRAKEILEKNFPVQETQITLKDFYYVKLSGAINTIKKTCGETKYYNTDAWGFLKSLEEDLKFDPKGKEIFVNGCGGAGRAVIAALSWSNVGIKKIYVNDINEQAIDSAKKHFSHLPQWSELKDRLQFISKDRIQDFINKAQLFVNASPIGMKEVDIPAVKKDWLHRDLSIYDVVYNRVTELVKFGKELGIPATGGLGMLLYQGAAAFEIWTEKPAPIEEMRYALKEEMNKCH